MHLENFSGWMREVFHWLKEIEFWSRFTSTASREPYLGDQMKEKFVEIGDTLVLQSRILLTEYILVRPTNVVEDVSQAENFKKYPKIYSTY